MLCNLSTSAINTGLLCRVPQETGFQTLKSEQHPTWVSSNPVHPQQLQGPCTQAPRLFLRPSEAGIMAHL